MNFNTLELFMNKLLENLNFFFFYHIQNYKNNNHIEKKVFTNTTHGCAEDTMTNDI